MRRRRQPTDSAQPEPFYWSIEVDALKGLLNASEVAIVIIEESTVYNLGGKWQVRAKVDGEQRILATEEGPERALRSAIQCARAAMAAQEFPVLEDQS